MCLLYVSNDALESVYKMGGKSASRKFEPPQKRMGSFENMVMSLFPRVRPQFKLQCFYKTGTEKKIDANSIDCFCGHRNTLFQAMGCSYFIV